MQWSKFALFLYLNLLLHHCFFALLVQFRWRVSQTVSLKSFNAFLYVFRLPLESLLSLIWFFEGHCLEQLAWYWKTMAWSKKRVCFAKSGLSQLWFVLHALLLCFPLGWGRRLWNVLNRRERIWLDLHLTTLKM